MDQQLLCGYIRQNSCIQMINNYPIYRLCYQFYRHSKYHVTFGYVVSTKSNTEVNHIIQSLMNGIDCKTSANNSEIFNNHNYFTVLKVQSLQHLIMCDVIILSYPDYYNFWSYSTGSILVTEVKEEYKTKVKEFKQNLQMYHQFGIQSVIIISDRKHEMQRYLTENNIDITVQFINKKEKIKLISETFSQIINFIIDNKKLTEKKENLTKQPFLMSINHGFNKKSNDKVFKVFIGQIIRGNIQIGDKVKFIHKNIQKYNQIGIVKSIQMYGKSVGILALSKNGDHIGICVEFNTSYSLNVYGVKGLLMSPASTLSYVPTATTFVIEFHNVSVKFLRWILKYYGNTHKKITKNRTNKPGYYPRINCFRTIQTGYQQKGCILKRISLIKNDDILDSSDTSRFYDGRWSKDIYNHWFKGYNARLTFQGNIFVTTYAESAFFGSVCMMHGSTKIGYGKIIDVGNDILNTKYESINSLIVSKWVRDSIPSVKYPFDLRNIILKYSNKADYPLNINRLYQILSYDTDRSRMQVALNEIAKNIEISYGSNKYRGTYSIMLNDPVANNKYEGINEIKIKFEKRTDCGVNFGIANNVPFVFNDCTDWIGSVDPDKVDDKLVAYVYDESRCRFIKVKKKQPIILKDDFDTYFDDGDIIRITIDSNNFINWRLPGNHIQKFLIDEFETESFYFFIEVCGIDDSDHYIRFTIS